MSWSILSNRKIKYYPTVDKKTGIEGFGRTNIAIVELGFHCKDGSIYKCKVVRTRHGLSFEWPDGHKESSKPPILFWTWLVAKIGQDLAWEVQVLID